MYAVCMYDPICICKMFLTIFHYLYSYILYMHIRYMCNSPFWSF